MTLKPSMREKWRYISFRLEAAGEPGEAEAKAGAGAPGEAEVKESIAKGMIRFIGELGASRAKPKVLEYSGAKREGLVRCTTEGVGEVRAALALMNNIGGRACAVRTLKTSGTILSLRAKQHTI
ncbi:Ribonuclease P protein component 2 [Candidatus Burarchaeum australiense]|nr:Ribonuclease P protein component 2 [Candidatus Burarchaeum australiense]